MTDEERLEYLGRVKNEAALKVYEQEKAVTEKLFSLLNELNEGGVPLRPLGAQETVRIEPYGDFREKGVRWRLSKEIEFSAWIKEDIEKGRRYDFGSSFSLYISSFKLSLNHGTCGTWDKSDRGQLSRLYLMTRLFENEDRIISELDAIINPQIIRDYYTASSEYSNLQDKIRDDQRKKEEEAILASIKPGMYFASVGVRWVYNQETGQNEEKYHYYSWEKINKITEKNFLTTDRYDYNYRRPIYHILNNLKYHYIFLINDPNDPVTEEHIALRKGK